MIKHSRMTKILLWLTVGLLVMMLAAPIAAQDDSDPLWRAFRAVRRALGEKFSVDLTIVQRYSWTETEFPNGIDDCRDLAEGATGEALYFGWRFVILALDGREFEGRSSFDSTVVVACDRVTAPVAAAPQPEPGSNPDLPAPVAGIASLSTFQLGGHVLEFSAQTIAAANSARMTWVKKQVRYTLGQDPGSVAGLIQQAKASGFRILLGIVGNPSEMGNYDDYIQQYASFVGGVAALGADAIEVWNEPNIDREWPAAQINGATYTRMLAASFNAIKSRNPNTIVISGAPAPTGFFGTAGCGAGGCNDDTFMQQMAAAGAANYMDCVGLHYNEGIIPPNQSSGDPRGGYPTYFFGSMTGRGYAPFGGRPVCYTELGYLSPQGFAQPLPGGFAWAQNTTVAQHAQWLGDAARIARQGGIVKMMIVWNVDFPMFTATDPMGGYAMIRPDGTCPACSTLAAAMQ